MSNRVGNVSNSSATQNDYNTVQGQKAKNETIVDVLSDPAATYTPSTQQKSGVYSKGSATIARLWDELNNATESLRNLVASMLGKNNAGERTGQAYWAMVANPEKYGIVVDDETRTEAERMVGEDGFFGIKQTTDRIMDFAKALAGDGADAKTIENLREGTKKGFDDVAKMFGGFDKLPDVTKKTYEALMKEFDNWKTSIAAE